MTAFALTGVCFAFFGIEGCGFEDDAFLASRFDCCNVGVEADVYAFGFQIVIPVAIESLEMGEGDHLR